MKTSVETPENAETENTDSSRILSSLTKIFIVGAGKGGSSIISSLSKEKKTALIGLATKIKKKPAVTLANKLGIPVFEDYTKPISDLNPDIVINVSGNFNLSDKIRCIEGFSGDVIEGWSAKFIWNILKERDKREKEINQELADKEYFNKIGILLLSYFKLDDLLDSILKCAMEMINAPAGSIALLNNTGSTLKLHAVQGFSKEFSKITQWNVRPKGMTSSILSSQEPLIIKDISKTPDFQNPVLIKEGVKSLMAVPLVVDKRVSGILYLDDFSVRGFSKREISCMKFLAIQATLAIEKAMFICQMEKMAITDELTGLYNHRYFSKSLTSEIERSKRFEYQTTLIMADIDHFKHYNDTNGHLKGNDVLSKVAGIIKRNTRNIDIPARYGGEEFAIILVESAKKSSIPAAERIRKAIEQGIFENAAAQPGGKLTLSIGVASYPEDANDADSLIEAADKALYRSKESGRNKVSL